MDILLKAVQRIKHRYSDNKVTFDRLIEVLNVAEDIKQEEIAQKDIQYEIAMNEIHKHKNPF